MLEYHLGHLVLAGMVGWFIGGLCVLGVHELAEWIERREEKRRCVNSIYWKR